MSNGRETQVIETFLALTDSLVADFDVLDLLTMLAERSVELLDVTAAGIILSDGNGAGRLSVAAASSEESLLFEMFAVALADGPCVDCAHTGEPVIVRDLAAGDARARWPRFTAEAAGGGFRAVHALPMRHRDQVIGVLTLLHTDPHTLTDPDVRLGQALADAATVGLLHERAVRRAEIVTEQLRGALNSRIIIEQAKGRLAQHSGISIDEAFHMLRRHARGGGLRLTELCRDVVTGTVDPATVTGSSRSDQSPPAGPA